jgi:hypothetical protein
MLENVVSGQVVQVEACRVWVGVGEPRKVPKIADDADVPVDDRAQDVNRSRLADAFAIARQVTMVGKGVEQGTRTSHWF